MSDLTCEERIDEYLATVAGEIKEMYKADVENGNGYDPHHALHVDVVVDENGKPEYGQYLMSCGFTTTVRLNTSLWIVLMALHVTSQSMSGQSGLSMN